MISFGDKIRNLRLNRKLLLRTVAAFLDIDQAILSKIETGKRQASRDQVLKLADYYREDPHEMLTAWLSEKLVHAVRDEEVALEALKVAEDKVAYLGFKKIDRKQLVNKLKEGIGKFPDIERAWIYGSFSREDDGPKSDIDIAIKTNDTFSYFDLAEVQYQLELLVKRKVDVGFIQAFKPYIFKHIQPDLKLIYEKSS